MDEQQTCGKGLAERSVLPAKMGVLTAALAENLEMHMTALDPTDENSRKELEAYRELAKSHRSIATHLEATAARMAAYRDLPMGRHDMKAMSDPKMFFGFETFVVLEEELLALLEKSVEQDRQMLAGFRSAASGASR